MKPIIVTPVLLAVLLVGLPLTGSAQTLAGDWQGRANSQFTLALHVVAKGGGYTATADNAKLGFIKVPAALTVAGSNVSFTTSALGTSAAFSGTWDGNNTITGTFTQYTGSTPVALTLTRASSPPSVSSPPPGPTVAGAWRGNISAQLPMVLNVVASGSGYTATADNPKMGFVKVPATITVKKHHVTFHVDIPGSPGDFTGTWRKNKMTGTFQMGGKTTPLTLTR